jgi:hypothetical protein
MSEAAGSSVKKRAASALGGGVATAAIVAGYGIMNWKALAGCAALGAVGGFCGVNVPGLLRRYAARRKAPAPE